MNSWTGIGRCVRDIELKYLQNGTATASFTIAIDKGLSKDKKQEFESQNKPSADFINIVTWAMIDWGDKKENTGGHQDFHPIDNTDIPF